jgi:nicotinamidase-related amidase
MEVDNADTAVVFIDPQNDVLSKKGANWGVLGASVTENGTVENMVKIFEAAKAKDYLVFISPHYFFPTSHSAAVIMRCRCDSFMERPVYF